MRPISKVFLVLALCLLAVAWYLHQSARDTLNRKWSPLQQAVQVKRGLILSSAFEVDFDDFYEVSLDVERTLPFERTNCLLAIETVKIDQCREVTPIGEVKWSLYDGEKLVASGASIGIDSGAGQWGTTIGRNIGRFKGVAHTKYVLRVESSSDAVELNKANPRIVVSVNVMSFKTAFTSAGLTNLASLVFAVLGSIILISIALVAIRRRKQPGELA